MIDTFLGGGLVMWPLLAVAIGIVWNSLRAIVRLRGAAPPLEEVDNLLRRLLFWGVMSVVLGTLGTIMGLVAMTQAIHLAGALEPPLVWGAVRVSLISLAFGLMVFLFAATVWLLLHQWSLRTAARTGTMTS